VGQATPRLFAKLHLMSVIAVAEMFGISGRREELAALLEGLERQAVEQSGCRRYTVVATLADPTRFLLVSEWESQAALDAHYRCKGSRTSNSGLRAFSLGPER
jgi:quinol monooxygenase YgiN